MIRNLLFTAIFSIITIGASAQCMDWVKPSPTAGWTDFKIVPCNGEFKLMDMFEVNASEAYRMEGVMVDGNYTFSMCDGAGAGSWVPDFTIIAPSGAVDAFGAGDGDGCSITWTATEDGDYLVVINEADNCGVDNIIDNGNPKIMTNSGGAACIEFIEGSESFEGSDTDLPECWQAIDADGDGNNWEIVPFDDSEVIFNGANAIASFSYINDVGDITPDNYLITPKLDITAGDSLYYVVNALDPDWPEEKYSVLVSTASSAIADFTTVAFTETLTSGDFEPRTVDLSAYAGQSIYIAFRHHNSTGNYAILLDAIYLPGVNCNPLAVQEVENVESKLYPNPATDNLNITSSLQGAATINIFDAVGRVVSQKNVNLSDAIYTQNISSLESGVYVIQIQAGDKMTTQRFIKQ